MSLVNEQINFLNFERKVFKIPDRKNYLLFLPSTITLHEITPVIRDILEKNNNLVDLINSKSEKLGYSKDIILEAFDELIDFAKVIHAATKQVPPWGKRFLQESQRYQICTIDIFLTHSCNMNCTYCCEKGGDFGFDLSPKMMSWQTAKKTLDWFFRNNKDGKYPLTISFFGGEPLLNREVFEKSLKYVQEIRENGNYPAIKQVITTNGTLLDDDIFKLLDRYSCELLVSLDSSKHLHDRNRCFKNGGKTYDLIIDKIHWALKRYPNLKIETNSTLGKEDNIRDFFLNRFFDKRVLKRYNIRHSIIGDFLEENSSSYKKIIDDLSSAYKRQYRSVLKNGLSAGCVTSDPFFFARLNSVDKDRIYRKTNCSAGLTKVAVIANGDIFICALSLYDRHKWKIGNVFEGLNKKKYKWLINKYNRLLQARKECASCWARYLCSGICPISKISFTPSLSDKAGTCCVLRLYMEYSLRLYGLIKSEHDLRELYPAVLKDNLKKALTFNELARYTLVFRALANRKHKHIKHVTPFPIC